MEVQLDVSEYLSNEQIESACKEAVTYKVSQWLGNGQDFERILNNAAYKIVYQMIDESVCGTAAEVIHAKAMQIIEDPKSYSVFRAKSQWGDPASTAHNLLEKAVVDNAGLIEDQVKRKLLAIPDDQMHELVMEAVSYIIDKKLKA